VPPTEQTSNVKVLKKQLGSVLFYANGYRRVIYPDTGCIQKFRVNYVEAISVRNEKITARSETPASWLDVLARNCPAGMVMLEWFCVSLKGDTPELSTGSSSQCAHDGVDTCEGKAIGWCCGETHAQPRAT